MSSEGSTCLLLPSTVSMEEYRCPTLKGGCWGFEPMSLCVCRQFTKWTISTAPALSISVVLVSCFSFWLVLLIRVLYMWFISNHMGIHSSVIIYGDGYIVLLYWGVCVCSCRHMCKGMHAYRGQRSTLSSLSLDLATLFFWDRVSPCPGACWLGYDGW